MLDDPHAVALIEKVLTVDHHMDHSVHQGVEHNMDHDVDQDIDHVNGLHPGPCHGPHRGPYHGPHCGLSHDLCNVPDLGPDILMT